jgi:putative transposase
MEAMTKKGYHLEELSEAFEVSRSGYYGHRRRERAPRRQQDAQLRPLVARAFHESRRTYGTPRLRAALRRTGACLSRQRIARLMREAGLQPLQKRRRFIPRTTIADPAARPAANLLLVAPPPTRIDEVWVCDITYIATAEGWLYLAAVMDLYSRRILGWATSASLDTPLVTEAWSRARATRARAPLRGTIVHSDRGTQYTSAEHRSLLRISGMVASMSRTANCYDNAAMESFWASLKTEAFHSAPDSRASARVIIHDYIDAFYNTRRLHSSLQFKSPLEFEQSPPNSQN